MKAIVKSIGPSALLAVITVSIVACESASTASPLSARIAETRTSAPVSEVASTPTRSIPTPTPAPARSLVVANTGGLGVYIRPEPGSSERIRAWPDGTPLVRIGEDRSAGGRIWKNVKDPDGNSGWVAADFLVEQAQSSGGS